MTMNRHRFTLLFYILSVHVSSSVSDEKCILPNPKDSSKVKLLDEISPLKGIKYYSAENGTYAVSICSDVSKGNHSNASVSFTFKNSTTILGRYNETDIVKLRGNEILLTYSGGDVMNKSKFCNNTRWKTLVFITCDYDADDINIGLLDPLNGGCFALFHLKTAVICPPRQSTFLRWFLLIIAVTLSYFICGIFYKRYVEGAKGWEQVPHHDFLRNPLQHLMGCLRGKEDMPISRNGSNDPADEPLLRP